MKRLKKALAILLSAAMVLGMGSMAFADNTTATPTGGLTLDEEISISGLTENDEVKLYRVVEWVNNDGWTRAEGFEGLSDADFKQIVGSPSDATANPPAQEIKAKIEAATAGRIGEQIDENTPVAYGPLQAGTDGTVKVSSPVAGLYIAIITPAKAGYVYNPVFVSCDYKQPESGNTNTWGVTEDLSYDDQTKAMAKKTTLPDKKKATLSDAEILAIYADQHPETVKIGSKVPFTVESVIPKFASNYTNPVFKVTDTLSAGMELDLDSVVIVKPADLSTNDYTLTKSATGFELVFDHDFLKTPGPALDLEITYKATVTSDAVTNIDRMTNTVDIQYSHNPDDEDGYGLLRAKTNHYTFAIDGTLYGPDGGPTTEVVKIGVDSAGNEITKTVTINGNVTVGALQGAEFGLYTDEECTTLYTNDAVNPEFTGKVTSDADGRMTITGLDAGTYWLKEINAPAGYIKDTTAHKVEIVATYDDRTYTAMETIGEGEEEREVEVTYTEKILKDYMIKIDGEETASYTVKNDHEDDMEVTPDYSINGQDFTGKLRNVQGTELPATGGMGTTLFYIIGSILVIGAGIVLVAKKRMSAQ